MKKIIFILSLTIFGLIIFQKQVIAHSRGVPIFKINGVLAKVYPIELTSITPYLSDSSDMASENYLVNQNLEFEFEASLSAQMRELIGWSNEVLKKVAYIWDFGDGSTKLKTDGPKTSHTYTKMGSYIMQIEADYSQTGIPNVDNPRVQSTLIHVLPDKEYQLPVPIIKVNGQLVPSSGSLSFDFNKRLTFDGSGSKAPSSRIIQYQWDIKQGNVVKSETASIKYKLPQYYTTPVLRIKDENGFIAEASVSLTNSGKNEPSGFSLEDTISPTTLLILAQVATLGIGLTWYLKRRKRSKYH